MSGHNGAVPRAIIFDFDGVILESADIKTEAFVELFADHPEHSDAILRHHLENQGVSRYEKFDWIYRELLSRPLNSAERLRLGETFSDLVLQRILACDFVPGALELLRGLRGRCPSFVASGTPQEELRSIVEQRGLDLWFDGVWGTPASKPEIIRAILADHDLQPEDVLFVGDGVSDHAAAIECGLPFIARDTPAVSERWRSLEVTCVADMTALAARLGIRLVEAGP